jgi:hypothetical protein
MAKTPEPKAVARQPKCTSDQPTIGTEMPPTASPSDSASARPPALEPVDERDVDREKAAHARAERDDDDAA